MANELDIATDDARFSVVRRLPTFPRLVLGPLIWVGGCAMLLYALFGQETDPIVTPLVIGAGWIVGPALTLGRRGFTIDREAGLVEWWWGLLRPMHRKIRALDAPEEVLIREHRAHEDRRYPVWLILRDDNVPVADPHAPAEAEALARRLAEFLDVPIHDDRPAGH